MRGLIFGAHLVGAPVTLHVRPRSVMVPSNGNRSVGQKQACGIANNSARECAGQIFEWIWLVRAADLLPEIRTSGYLKTAPWWVDWW